MPSNRSEMMKAIQSDYPLMPDFLIDLVLDVYEKNPQYIEDWIKEEKKRTKMKHPPAPKHTFTLEDLERLHAAKTPEIIENPETPSSPS